MQNRLFTLVKTSRIPIIELAKQVGVSRNTISQLIAPRRLPRNVKLETLDKIAAGLGYRVRVEFVIPCPDCNSLITDHIGGDNYRCEDCGHHFAS